MKHDMKVEKFKKVYLLIVSIPLTILFHYFVTMHLLDYIHYFETKGYIMSLFIQLFLWYEILVFFFDKLEKIDQYMIAIVYDLLFLFSLFARPYQRELIVNLNPFDIVSQLHSLQDIVICIFNIGVFIPLLTINSFFVKKLQHNVLLCIVIAFMVELLQVLLHRGIFDICDILLYFIGIAIGVVVLRWLKKNNKC